MNRELEIKRGMVFYANLSNNSVGSVQTGRRPVVIIQNDIGNKYSPCVIVAVITSQTQKAKLPTHVLLPKETNQFLNRDSMITAEQTFTISKQQLDTYLGTLSDCTIEELNKAVAISLGLHTKEKAILEDKINYINELEGFIIKWIDKGRSIKEVTDEMIELRTRVEDYNVFCKKFGLENKYKSRLMSINLGMIRGQRQAV